MINRFVNAHFPGAKINLFFKKNSFLRENYGPLKIQMPGSETVVNGMIKKQGIIFE